MNRETAQALLESLLERVEGDGQGGKWKLGTISNREKQALEFALHELTPAEIHVDVLKVVPVQSAAATSATHATTHPATHIVMQEPEPVPEPEIPVRLTVLNQRSADLTEPEDRETTLCLDFGTAMSKAFAIRGSDTPVELALGKRAGGSGYPVDSSMFISDDGLLYFGPQAVQKGIDAAETGRTRFDSPKSRLSVGVQGDIMRIPVNQEINPTDIPMSEGEMITLYLAYLTDLATSELEAQSSSRYVLRRFARPCWDSARNEWAEKLMRKMLAQAQVLADTFHDCWQDGLQLSEAKAALENLKTLERLPDVLIERSVPEPVAAAASLMLGEEAQREVFLVIDVGAGTTDFGLFLLQHNPDKNVCRVHGIPGSVQYVPQAGDAVDSMLKLFILEQAGIVPTDQHYGRHVGAELQSLIRMHKEALFRDGSVEVTLSNQSVVTVDLEDFQNLNTVRNFTQLLETMVSSVMRSIEGMDTKWRDLILEVIENGHLNVVLTGGGARLPMIQSLASGVIEVLGRHVLRRPSRQVPAWIEETYPQFTSQYSQLAVAIGGASPDLPDMGTAFGQL